MRFLPNESLRHYGTFGQGDCGKAVNDADICVYAYTGQLNRNLEPSKSSMLAAATLVLAGILSLSTTQVAGQAVLTIEQHTATESIKLKNGEFIINGTVSDSVAPLSDVLVWRAKKRGKKKVKILEEIRTRDGGLFSFKTRVGEFLIFTRKGYEPLLVKITDTLPDLNVVMEKKPEAVILLGKMRVDRTAIPKQNIDKPGNFNE